MFEGPWYYCLKHHTVEPATDGCKAADRLGPYESIEDAERALERVAQRNDAWDHDPRFTDEDADD